MPLPLLAPLVATGISALGQVASNYLTRPKKRRSYVMDQLRYLDENAAQNANQATANAGALLGPALTARGMQNSNVGANTLAGLASSNTQAALAESQRAKLPLMLAEQDRTDALDAERRQGNRQMLSGLADTAATNVAGFGALKEQDAWYTKLMAQVKSMFPDDPEKQREVLRIMMQSQGQTQGQRPIGSYGMIPQFRG